MYVNDRDELVLCCEKKQTRLTLQVLRVNALPSGAEYCYGLASIWSN